MLLRFSELLLLSTLLTFLFLSANYTHEHCIIADYYCVCVNLTCDTCNSFADSSYTQSHTFYSQLSNVKYFNYIYVYLYTPATFTTTPITCYSICVIIKLHAAGLPWQASLRARVCVCVCMTAQSSPYRASLVCCKYT